MPEPPKDDIAATVATLFERDSRKVLATLIRLLGDFDLAEEAVQDAFKAAIEQWPRDGIPANPVPWLVSAGRFKAIDAIRRRARFDAIDEAGDVATAVEAIPDRAARWDEGEEIADDPLRLVFTCCHPSLSADAQVALTLREISGLTTEEIARAFLAPPATIAQRIVRAKAKIRDARIPYQVPSANELGERLASVLRVVYLVFNEGYSASAGAALTRADLCAEAIRLARLVVGLLPEREAMGLLALTLLQESRRAARTGPNGELVVLEAQDRSRWNRAQIEEGLAWVERALGAGAPEALPRPGATAPRSDSPGARFGPYALQAAIAAVHASAASAEATDWAEIVGLYDVLARMQPTPVVALNRAVAVAMRDGPAAGLALIETVLADGQLQDYHLAHAARADICRRLGRHGDARASYERALALVRQEPERAFLAARLRDLPP
ncbi:MAG: RNA polymerase sigma factor [Pseudomonadota bacterium]|nr:RNA polymerase sigma factor [Pseudomonadota bacterium]